MKKALCLLLFLFLVGCAADTTQENQNIGELISLYGTEQPEFEQKPEPVHVGMLLPLSGKRAALGDDFRNAGVLAQFEVASDNIALHFYDTKGTPEGAKEAFAQAKNENISVILGPVLSAEVAVVAPLARRYDIPVFSFTSDKKNLGKNVYSLALTIENQTQRIIRFACEKGARRLAIMAPEDPAGDIAVSVANKTALECGMDVRLSVYKPNFINFEPFVASALPEKYVTSRKNKRQAKKDLRTGRIKKKDITNEANAEEQELSIADQVGFDALFIADDGNRLKAISSLFGLYDVTPDDVLFLGLSTWNDPSLSLEGSLKNAYYPALPTSGYNAFAKKFEQTYGRKPNRLASLAYDSVALVSVLAQYENWTDVMEQNRMGYLGSDGLFRFNSDGTVERLMGIFQIKSGKKVPTRIEKPSQSFQEEDIKKQHLSEIPQENAAALEEPALMEEVYYQPEPQPVPMTEEEELMD